MIHLFLQEDGVFIELENDGKKEFREVNIKELIDIFNSAVRDVVEDVIETPLLPPGTIKFDIDPSNPANYKLYMFKEPTIGPITFESRQYTVGYPASVHLFKVRNRVVTQVKIWAIQGKNLTPDAPIYHYPYFNAYSDGRICIGTNRIPVEEPWQLFKMPDILKVMPSNLGLSTHNNAGLQGDSLLKAVEDKPFPDTWLKPYHKKLKDILKEG